MKGLQIFDRLNGARDLLAKLKLSQKHWNLTFDTHQTFRRPNKANNDFSRLTGRLRLPSLLRQQRTTLV